MMRQALAVLLLGLACTPAATEIANVPEGFGVPEWGLAGMSGADLWLKRQDTPATKFQMAHWNGKAWQTFTADAVVAARGGATGLEVTPQVRAGEVLAIDAKGYFFLDATGAVTWSAEVPPGVQAGEVPRKVRFENGVLYVALGPKVWRRESSMWSSLPDASDDVVAIEVSADDRVLLVTRANVLVLNNGAWASVNFPSAVGANRFGTAAWLPHFQGAKVWALSAPGMVNTSGATVSVAGQRWQGTEVVPTMWSWPVTKGSTEVVWGFAPVSGGRLGVVNLVTSTANASAELRLWPLRDDAIAGTPVVALSLNDVNQFLLGPVLLRDGSWAAMVQRSDFTRYLTHVAAP